MQRFEPDSSVERATNVAAIYETIMNLFLAPADSTDTAATGLESTTTFKARDAIGDITERVTAIAERSEAQPDFIASSIVDRDFPNFDLQEDDIE
jgi:hypothetical protein